MDELTHILENVLMKMKQTHFDYIENVIKNKLSLHPNLIEKYETGNFPRADKVKDLQVRFNFDLAYSAGLNPLICELYSYLNDNQIQTALKAICPTVIKKY